MLLPVIVVLLFCSLSRGSNKNLNKLSVANNDLAIKLYKRLSSDSSENIFFSPLSISSALGMLFYGARGSTAKELRNVLGYDHAELSNDKVHASFKHLIVHLEPSKKSKYVFNLANAILFNRKLDIVSSYKSDMKDIYKALIREVDFEKEGDKIVDEVNAWVKDNTNGKIDEILDILDPSTAMVVLNAVYFKGTWEVPFDPNETSDETFYNSGLGTNTVKVPMMQQTNFFNFVSLDNMQVLELPYKGKNMSMMVLLPNKRDGLAAIEKKLTLEKLSTIGTKLSMKSIEVTLPKFKLEYSQELSSDFKALGAESIFKARVVDFSGISKDKNRKIVVDQIFHKAFVEVNELGTEAAAVTGGLMMAYFHKPIEFKADHPFIFAIVDKSINMIVFAGRVCNLK